MEGLPDDVLRFIERRFAQKSLEKVYGLLKAEEVRTPRVMRSVLFLSNGSLSLLEHCITACRRDVREVLTGAEYVVGVADEPMPIRDMSLPFNHDGNLGEDYFTNTLGDIRQHPGWPSPKRQNAKTGPSHHSYLAQRGFELGEVTYIVAKKQPNRNHVRCYRRSGPVNSVVRLPLLFVLEQLAECIELEATNF